MDRTALTDRSLPTCVLRIIHLAAAPHVPNSPTRHSNDTRRGSCVGASSKNFWHNTDPATYGQYPRWKASGKLGGKPVDSDGGLSDALV